MPDPAPRPATPRLLLLALLLTGAYHGTLVLTRAYRGADGAGALQFLASAYARHPLDPWDDRWYGGVPLTGEAPLAAQLIALLSGALGLEGAYGAAQFLAAALLAWGAYRAALACSSARVAGVATLLVTLGSALTLQLNVFGHLGAVFAAGLALHAAPPLWAWLRGEARVGRRALPPLLAAGTADPVTALLLGGALLLAGPGARGRRRAAGGTLLLAQAALSGWAGWLWSPLALTLPAPPPPGAGRSVWLCLLLPLWSVQWVLPALPGLRRAGPRGWGVTERLALVGAALLPGAALLWLPLVGSAGRGPLRLPAPETVVFIASLLLLPLAARVALRAWDAARAPTGPGPLPLVGAAALTLIVTVGLNALPRTRPLEPAPLNFAPLLNFIEKDEHWRYRFLTVGFGRQLGLLTAQTRAATPAGLWHLPPDLPQPLAPPGAFAGLPERADLPGAGSLSALLTHPERSYLKFVYAASPALDPLLFLHGWHAIGTLENGVVVWEREDVPPLPARLPRSALPPWAAALWGVGPLAALLAAGLAITRAAPSERARGRVQPGAAGMGSAGQTGTDRAGTGQTGAGASLPDARTAAWGPVRVVTGVTLLVLAGGLALRLSPGWALERDWTARARAGMTGGGLRGEFARLEGIRYRLTRPAGPPPTDRWAWQARVTAQWWTPLGARQTAGTQTLHFGRGGWVVTPPEAGALALRRVVPSPQAAAAYDRAPRRITTNATAPADVLDRPVVQVLSARTVTLAGRVVAVGSLLNADARPADLTLSATLRGPDGQVIVSGNAGLSVLHKLRPGERTPWLVRLPPLPPGTDPATLTLDVAARAVVTGRSLERPLAARSRVQGGRVLVEARNVSTRTLAVPQALLAVSDARGVAWVRGVVGPALPPGAVWTFSLPAAPPANARVRVQEVAGPPDAGTVRPARTAPGSFPLPDTVLTGGSYTLTFQVLPDAASPEEP
ncbi:hypothetical protein [Deinococcus indicus]|uniref:hypothetical protein n=1 Tax=Deinococcus indicus TaxID=223556 RepID=UPI00174CBB9A|nr:hypothetical protein [Deinococcus indicus]